MIPCDRILISILPKSPPPTHLPSVTIPLKPKSNHSSTWLQLSALFIVISKLSIAAPQSQPSSATQEDAMHTSQTGYVCRWVFSTTVMVLSNPSIPSSLTPLLTLRILLLWATMKLGSNTVGLCSPWCHCRVQGF